MDQRYTIAEIDAMRRMIHYIVTPPLQPYNPKEKDSEVENLLRTYMMNGTSVQEIQEEYDRVNEDRNPPWPSKPPLPAAYAYEWRSCWVSGHAQGTNYAVYRKGEDTGIVMEWWREHPHAPAQIIWLRDGAKYSSLEDAITRSKPANPR